MNNNRSVSKLGTAPPDTEISQTQGTQSLRRALSLLKVIARRNVVGARLSELIAETGLGKATAYRLLSCMVEEAFLERDEHHVYRVGTESFLLGSLMMYQAPLVERFSGAMRRITQRTGDTVFMMMRHGDYACCANREDSPSTVKVLTTHIGQRRLIGTGTVGVAMLGALSDDQISAIYERHIDEYKQLKLSVEHLHQEACKVRKKGYAVTFNTVEAGVGGLGVVLTIKGYGLVGFSIGTLNGRLEKKERQKEIAQTLNQELLPVLHQLQRG